MFQRGRVVLGEIAVSTVKTVALAISLTGTSAGALSSSPSSRSYIVSPLSFTATFLGPSHRAMSSIFGTWMRSALPQYSPSRLTVALSATILILGSAAFKRETTTSRVAPRVSRKKWTLSSVIYSCKDGKRTSSIMMRARRLSPELSALPRLVSDSHFSGCESAKTPAQKKGRR